MGEENRITTDDSVTTVGAKLTMSASKDIRIRSETGSVTLDSGIGITTISGNHVLIDAKNTLVLKGAKIVRDDDAAEEKIKGSWEQSIGGSNKTNQQKKDDSTIGDSNENVGGTKSSTAGAKKLVVSGAGLLFGDTTAIDTVATIGKVVTTVTTPGPQSGIVSQIGPGGSASKIEQSGIGDIDIKSMVGPGGVTLFATKTITLDALVEVVVKAVKSIAIGSSTTAQVNIEASNIAVGGATEPMVLGKSFMSDLMSKHTHESSVGPTTGISPSFVSKIQSSLSKKCFLG
jgi:hypothetical protein